MDTFVSREDQDEEIRKRGEKDGWGVDGAWSKLLNAHTPIERGR